MKKSANLDNFNGVFPTRLRKLIHDNKTTISAVAECTGFSRQAVSQYQDGTTQPNVDTLRKIAEHFNVSADYLLGLSDVKSPDADAKAINKQTGLSERSIENLTIYKEYPNVIGFIDAIIANSNVFTTLSHYANAYFDSLYRCKKLKEKYPQHDFEHLHIHLFTGEEDIAVDEKHETEERELHDIYENEVDNVQPLQLYKLQNFFMDFIKAYGKAVLKDGGKNG